VGDKRAKRLQDYGSGAALVVGSWEWFRAAVARDLKGQTREEMRGKYLHQVRRVEYWKGEVG
jgi:hypothetical protein